MDDAGLHRRERPDIAYYFRQALESVTDQDKHVLGSPVANVSEHGHPELGAFTTGPSPKPQNVFLTLESDPNCCINGPISHLTVPDFHHNRVNENGRVNLIQGPCGPVIHFLDHLVSDPRNCFLGDRCAINFREMRTDLTRSQTLGIKRENYLINLT